jgi:putative ABC transport system permease protein
MLSLSEIIRQALKSVRANLLRSVLTLLIIAVGITALVGILAAIDSFVYSLSDNLSSLGANGFSIYPKGKALRGNRRGMQQKSGDEITLEEALTFKERLQINGRTSIDVNGANGTTVKYGDEKTNPNVRVTGIDVNYLTANAYSISTGREFSETEQETGANKAVIGQDIVKALFKNKEDKAIGEEILVGNIKYKVVGVLKAKGSSMNSSGDRIILVPLFNIRRHYSSANSNHRITVSVYNATDMDDAISQSTGLFRAIRKIPLSQDDDFEIFKSDGLVAILKDNTVKIRLGTIAVGLMTLLGAAIGLMNIMLVSVTERTKEIGICKALGATQRSILTQFLTEAVVICQLGGLVGIIFGVLIGFGVSKLMGGTFHVPWLWILLGVVTCLVVGLISGLYPALKASRLDPIESLRYE